MNNDSIFTLKAVSDVHSALTPFMDENVCKLAIYTVFKNSKWLLILNRSKYDAITTVDGYFTSTATTPCVSGDEKYLK